MAPPEPPEYITLKIKVPPGSLVDQASGNTSSTIHGNRNTAEEFTLGSVRTDATIGSIRERLREVLPMQPLSARQRLIFQARLLQNDDQTLLEALNMRRNPTQTEYTIHLVLPSEGRGRNNNPRLSNHNLADRTPSSNSSTHHDIRNMVNPSPHLGERTDPDPGPNTSSNAQDQTSSRRNGSPSTPQPRPEGQHPRLPWQWSPIAEEHLRPQGLDNEQQLYTILQQQQHMIHQLQRQQQMANLLRTQHDRLPDPFQGNPAQQSASQRPRAETGAQVPSNSTTTESQPPAEQPIPAQPASPAGTPSMPRLELARTDLQIVQEMLSGLLNSSPSPEQQRQFEELLHHVHSLQDYIDPFGVSSTAAPVLPNLNNLLSESNIGLSRESDIPARFNRQQNGEASNIGQAQVQMSFNGEPSIQLPITSQPNAGIQPDAPVPFPGQPIAPMPMMFAPIQIPMVLPQGHTGLQQITIQAGPQNVIVQPGQQDVVCYLLSGPEGPHALLFSPQHGAYTGIMPNLQTTAFTSPIDLLRPTPTVGNGQVPLQPEEARPRDPVEVAVHQQVQAAVAQQAQAQAQEALGPLQAVVGHLWLLLRILIFAYFFLGSNLGWHRPMLLLAIGAGFWMIRMGFVGEAAPLRRWWEGIVRVPHEQGANAHAQAQAQHRGQNQPGNREPQAGVNQTAGQTRATPMPTPEQVAQRILQEDAERRRQQGGWLREQLRPIERVLALFFASLWPGVGEEQVRVQEREQRRRQEEEQERQRQETEARNALEKAQPDGDDGIAKASSSGNTSESPYAEVEKLQPDTSPGAGTSSSSS